MELVEVDFDGNWYGLRGPQNPNSRVTIWLDIGDLDDIYFLLEDATFEAADIKEKAEMYMKELADLRSEIESKWQQKELDEELQRESIIKDLEGDLK